MVVGTFGKQIKFILGCRYLKGEGSIDCTGYGLLANTLPPFEDEASACLVALVSERESEKLIDWDSLGVYEY